MSYNEQMYALGEHRSVIREIFEYSRRRAAEIGAENVFDFSLGNPSVEPPREVTDTLISLLSEYEPTALHGYTSAQGDAAARGAVAAYISRTFGVQMPADLIYMTCGAAASLAITLRALLNTGDECILCAPFFTEYRVFVENAGGIPVISTPVKGTLQIDVEDLASRITPRTRAVIVNSPNNPSGVVYTKETLRALCAVLEQKSKELGHTICLIADEPYRELAFDGVDVPYLMRYYDNTVVCYSFSKSLSLPGERIGYIAVSPTMQDANRIYLAVCGAGRSLGYVCAPSLLQRLVARVIGKTVDVGIYRENRDLLLSALTSYGFDCVRPDGAFYLMVKAPEEDATAFCERAKAHELLLVPCDDFAIEGYARIAYCVQKSQIERSLPAFRALADEYKTV